MTTLAKSYYITPGTLQDLLAKSKNGPRREQNLSVNRKYDRQFPPLRKKRGHFIRNTKCNRATVPSLPLKDMELAIVGQMKQLQLKKLESVPIGNDHDDEDYLECLKNEASLLASLGRVYFERGRASRQLGDLIRSAALYNSALARSVKRSVLDESGVENLPSRKLDVESELLSLLTGKRRRVANNNAEKLHRSELDKMRQMCCREIRDIDSNCSPYTAGGDEHWERVQESKRMRSIQRLYRDFNKRLRSMVTEMWKSCVQTLGRPNCKYALLATGDFGRGTVTPYADLELAVLIEESADMRRDKQLLKSLMQYLLLKFLNLGETILPSLGIKSINNFANPDGNWFIDLDTPRGVALHIPKPPVGAISLDKAILIKTPSKMVKFLLETSGGRMHRIQSPGSLLTVSFLAGSELLARNYQELVDCLLERPANPLNYGTDSDLMRSRIAESMLTRICRSCKPVIGLGDSIARFRNDLWIPTAIVSALALLSGISPGNPWSVLDEFRKRRQLRPEIINKLTFLLSVSAESKLKMEILRFAKSQTTAAIDLSIITSGPAMTDSYQSVCKFYQLLFHFADLAKEKLLKIPDPTAALESFQNNFVSTPTQQANIQLNLKLANHAEVDKVLLAVAEKDPENDRVTTDLICVLLKTRALSKISSVYAVLVQKLLAKIDSSTNDGSHEYDASTEGKTNFIKEARIFLQRSENALKREGDAEDDEMVLERAVALNNLGVAWFEFGKADKAQLCFQQCFMLWRRIHLSENGIHDDVADCLNKLGLCYGRTNDEENSIAHHRLALQMYLKIHDGDKAHPDIADTLVKLAHALGMSRKFHQALISQKEALHIFQVLWSCAVPHPDVAACLHGLGKTFYVLSQYDRALLCHTKAVSMYAQLYGEDPVRMEVAECFETLAEDFRVTGRLSDAIYNLEKASAIYEQIYGTNIPNPRLTYCYDNLGAVYYSSGDYENATMCYEQSLAMARAMHGDKYASIKLAEMMTNLGNARIALGEYGKAVECHRQVCKMYDTIHDKTLLHVDKVNGLCDLGSALELLGDFAGAIQCHQQAMEMAEKLNAGGAVSPLVAKCTAALGGAWCLVGNAQKSVRYLQGALDMFQEIYGKGGVHVDIASTLADLGNAWDVMGKHEKAVEHHTDALKMYKEIYGYDKPHPNIAMCMLNLGAAWSSLGDRKKSIECFSQALEQNRELFGKKSNHSRIATCLTHLGQSLCAAGESEKGLSHLEEALRINRSRVTSDAEVSGCHILRALINLGNATYEMKRYAKSIEYFEEALEIQKQYARNEADNSAIAETLKKIANAYQSQGEREKSFLYEKRERDVRSKLKNKHGTPAKSIIVHRVSRK